MKIDGKSLLLHAAAVARRADALQATAALAVDPLDQETAMMWRQRFGFRPSSELADRWRLWLPCGRSANGCGPAAQGPPGTRRPLQGMRAHADRAEPPRTRLRRSPRLCPPLGGRLAVLVVCRCRSDAIAYLPLMPAVAAVTCSSTIVWAGALQQGHLRRPTGRVVPQLTGGGRWAWVQSGARIARKHEPERRQFRLAVGRFRVLTVVSAAG